MMMKKAGQFLKLGFVALAATIFCSSVQAQSNAQNPGRQDVELKGTTPVVNTKAVHQGPQNGVRTQGIAKKSVNPKQASAARGGSLAVNSGSTARNCTSKSTMKPYSITRANFNKLPKDRQQFVLSNSNKYTIVD